MKLIQIHEAILSETYSNMAKQFVGQGASKEEVSKTITDYKQLIKDGRIHIKHNDTNQWAKSTWDKFKTFVDEWRDAPTHREITRPSVKKNTNYSKEIITLYDNKEWFILIPLSHRASCYYGGNSDWCTAKTKSTMYDEHVLDGDEVLVYFLAKSEDGLIPTYALKYAEDDDGISCEMWDRNNDSFPSSDVDNEDNLYPDELFQKVTGIDTDELWDTIKEKHGEQLSLSRDTERRANPTYVIRQAVEAGERDKEQESVIMRSSDAWEYADEFFPGGWPQAERAISTDGDASFMYAQNVVNHGNDVSDMIHSTIANSSEYNLDYMKWLHNKALATDSVMPTVLNYVRILSGVVNGKLPWPASIYQKEMK